MPVSFLERHVGTKVVYHNFLMSWRSTLYDIAEMPLAI